mgnify:FL=1
MYKGSITKSIVSLIFFEKLNLLSKNKIATDKIM